LESLCDQLEIDGRSLRNRLEINAIAAESPRVRCANCNRSSIVLIAQSLHNWCTIATQPLCNRYEIAAHNPFKFASQLL
jgi:hypothetical protein